MLECGNNDKGKIEVDNCMTPHNFVKTIAADAYSPHTVSI